jgi:hypothetical protein
MNTQEEDFEWWITMIPDRIEELKQSLPQEISSRLDSSIDSLNVVEKYLIENYTIDTLRSPQNASLYDGFARYIGHTFKRNVKDAYWAIELEDKTDVFYNLPTLIVKGTNTSPLCPLIMATTSIDRNTGNLLSNSITHYQEAPRLN